MLLAAVDQARRDISYSFESARFFRDDWFASFILGLENEGNFSRRSCQ